MPRKRNRIICTCQWCGSIFDVVPSRIALGHGKFCSISCHRKSHRRPAAERFWEAVDRGSDPDACWLWTKARDPNGYGRFGLGSKGSKTLLAHRMSWMLTHGSIPEGIDVCHNCPGRDNPSCVRPDHLFLGTHADNMKDAARKGMMRYGAMHGMAKLTDAAVLEIRRLYALGGFRYVDLARRFDVAHVTIYRAVNHIGWRHLA